MYIHTYTHIYIFIRNIIVRIKAGNLFLQSVQWVILKDVSWGQRNSTGVRAFALHMANMDSFPGISYGPMSPPEQE